MSSLIHDSVYVRTVKSKQSLQNEETYIKINIKRILPVNSFLLSDAPEWASCQSEQSLANITLAFSNLPVKQQVLQIYWFDAKTIVKELNFQITEVTSHQLKKRRSISAEEGSYEELNLQNLRRRSNSHDCQSAQFQSPQVGRLILTRSRDTSEEASTNRRRLQQIDKINKSVFLVATEEKQLLLSRSHFRTRVHCKTLELNNKSRAIVE